MAKKQDLPDGYVWEANQLLSGSKKRFPTYTFANGAKVVLEGTSRDGGAEAYDSKGRWLGLFANAGEAEEAAEHGNVSQFQQVVSELSTWVLWNDAVQHGGASVLEDDDGKQIIQVGDDVYLRAYKDPHGWTVEWLTEEVLNDQYWNQSHYLLVYADEPFVLK